MTHATHTPGPWTYKPAPHGSLQKHKVFGPKHADGHHYASFCEVREEADARLIAAAPDLLAALRCARTELAHLGYKNNGVLLEEINAAIAKAESAQ